MTITPCLIETSMVATLGDLNWLRNNESHLKNVFPETWTHFSNINILSVGYKLKLLGIDWRTEQQLANILAFFESVGLLLRDGHTVKRSNKLIFNS